jgi:sirohydrochlorin ferrochelatase
MSLGDPPPPSTAVLLMAHGSRRPEANADLQALAAEVRQAGYRVVEISFLELAPPDIPTGGRACVQPGIERVLMLPYFLSAGVHVVQDLESHRAALTTEFPQVDFLLCPPLGRHPLMLEIVLDRLRHPGFGAR